MNYSLAFLTSRGREDLAAITLDHFEAMVKPKPVQLLCVTDGDVAVPRLLYDEQTPWSVVSMGSQPQGFCKATDALWKLCQKADTDYVFWLEDDFRLLRAMDLRDLAHVVDMTPGLAQMALYRQPASDEEEAVGGYMNVHPDAYVPQGSGSVAWVKHWHHWTTNPSLIPRRVIRGNAWPQGPYCEGKFGIELRKREPDTCFGVWGTGEVWVEHIGARSGHGY